MCGICGKVDLRGQGIDRELISRMCQTLQHRGPDAEKVHVSGKVGLGQRRLSIIDLRDAATAPLSNEVGTVWVVFNGEIYNFRELRVRLEEKGHKFQTNTDTEVIVHLYEEHGLECLRYLRGMFAFAVWDASQERLFAARDRLGKKPFLYARTSHGLIFGSEIKALMVDPSVSVSPNLAAIHAYLVHQYVPSPATAFEGIHKLPPAHYLTYDNRGELKVEAYWQPPNPEKSTATQDELTERLVEHLREAVRLRLQADVPLGAFLSGGIDSSTVVALMAQQTPKAIKTFSVGFGQESHDELPFARDMARRYGTEHQELLVTPHVNELLPKLIWHYNEPFADTSAVPTYYLCEATRKHVTVALSGDGGDESFVGYDHYLATARWGAVDVIPSVVRRSLQAVAGSCLAPFSGYNLPARASRAVTMLGATLPERYRLQRSIVKPQERQFLFTPMLHQVGQQPAAGSLDLEWSPDIDPFDWMRLHDLTYYLPDCLMVKTDIASMANSLEVRCPLLDHQVVEFAATIPSSFKYNGGGTKQILRRAVASLLPPSILEKKKMGFDPPMAHWLRTELKELMRELLLDDRARRRGLFRPEAVRFLVEQHIAGKRDWHNRLWSLLVLELWFRQFVDKTACVLK